MMKYKFSLIFFLSFFLAFSQVKSEELLLKNDSIQLPGTLTYLNEQTPLLIWVHGSGRIDRNGNQISARITPNYIKEFRDCINKKNIAFYSYDKRSANPKNNFFLKETIYESLVSDLEVVVNHFKKDNKFSKIILIGHSQGSLTAMLTSKNIDKYISLAGPSKTIDVTMLNQFSKNNPIVVDTLRAHFKEVRETGSIKKVHYALKSFFSEPNLSFIKSWMRYNPVSEIKKVKVPILIINGTKDNQIPVQDAKDLHKSNPDSELVIIEDMTHILKIVERDKSNFNSSFNSSDSLSEELIEVVTAFIKK